MARIVFDLDGTLIDSAPDIQAIANRLLAQEGAAPVSLAETRDFIGNGAAVFVARMRKARGLAESTQARLHADFLAAYASAVELTVIYPGVRAALDVLEGQGHALGLCTNKPEGPTRAVLDHLGLTNRFGAILCGDSLPVPKPDPAPLHAAFDRLGDGPAVYVGDSEVDAETAQRAGVPFLLFTRGYRKTPVEQLYHTHGFDDFADLPGLVAQALEGEISCPGD